ncbi:hypothetical protein BROUX41_004169 [Berkeleyomyces rouxiae]|uniref:uncharacterized protein n=1 Tax=Berkeleyomyces rouxiae TaxID=2035830 RepID=UPI003B809290
MQFSTVALIAATGAMAALPYGSVPAGTGVKPQVTSTIFSTNVVTITDCEDYVTDCPSHATKVVTNVVAVTTTICDEEGKPTAPAAVPVPSAGGYHNGTAVSYPTGSVPAAKGEKPTKPAGLPYAPAGTGVIGNAAVPGTTLPAVVDEECETAQVRVITTSYTTVVPTVITVTDTVPCETYPATKPVAPSGVAPSGTGSVTPPSGVPVTAGAKSLAGSAVMAVVGAVAAFAFA